jgi:hypothetical protein
MGACRYRRWVFPAGTTDDRISYLFGAIGVTNLEAPAFLQGLLSLVHYGAEDEVRTRAPLLIRYVCTKRVKSLTLCYCGHGFSIRSFDA